MQAKFTVQMDSFRKINKIQHAWSNEAFKALLTIMDFDDVDTIDEAELREMCLMSLSDLVPQDAAIVVLTYLFPDLKRGKIEQMGHDMLEDRSWEEYPDCLYHERFFNAYELLREAFNGKFAKPTGVECTITVTAEHIEDMAVFDHSLTSSMVRLLASGQGEDALIHRLYEEQIQGKRFPESKGIVWQVKQITDTGLTRQFSLVSSYFWLGSFEQVESFNAVSHGDD